MAKHKKCKLDLNRVVEELELAYKKRKESEAEREKAKETFIKTYHILDAIGRIPKELPLQIRNRLLLNMFNVTDGDEEFVEDMLEWYANASASAKGLRIFAPPTGECLECGADCHLRTEGDVSVFDVQGHSFAKKITLRCHSCKITYQYSKYGKSDDGFRFYSCEREYVEASKCVFISKEICRMKSALSNYAQVSVQAFALSLNESIFGEDNTSSPDRRIASKAFYWFEVEKELRKLNQIDFLFPKNGTRFDDALKLIEQRKRRPVCPHSCTDACPNQKKGCDQMVVFDGIWKLTFTHCLMISKSHVKETVPILNLPDVCPGEPKAGHAFCEKHIDLIISRNQGLTDADKVPTVLGDFLQFCDVTMKESESEMDMASVSHKVIQTLARFGLDCSSSESVTSCNGTEEE